jgi:hypothetical protein
VGLGPVGDMQEKPWEVISRRVFISTAGNMRGQGIAIYGAGALAEGRQVKGAFQLNG